MNTTNITNEKATLVTQEGYKKLVEELENLKTVERKVVAERLKEAISYGDLSENSEYEEAKNYQAFVEGRIIDLEEKIKNAKIIKGKKGQSVQLGSEVTIQNVDDDSEKETYTIVGSTEADPLAHKISNESPVGAALIDKKKGDTIEVEVPAGVSRYTIVKVS